jgi:hypothetical protein
LCFFALGYCDRFGNSTEQTEDGLKTAQTLRWIFESGAN